MGTGTIRVELVGWERNLGREIINNSRKELYGIREK